MRKEQHVFSRLSGSLVSAVALVIGSSGSAVQPSSVALAATSWDIQVGGDVTDAVLTVNAFLPSTLTVHVGDTVTWTQASSLVPHDVAFLDGGPRLPDFAPSPTVQGELSLGPAAFPLARQDPVTAYAGTGVVNSGNLGVPDASPFRMTFSRPGVYAYACMFHPGMNGTIEVLPESAPLAETPQQAQARGRADADALLAQLRSDLQQVQATPTDLLGGPTVHAAVGGLSTGAGWGNAGGASALRFVPDALAVRRGDLVIWTLADPLEIHTVTFTSGASTPPLLDVRPQAEGPPLFAVSSDVARPTGGSIYTGDGYVNSGILKPGDSFALLIDAPPGTYEYVCLVHPNMKSTLSVTE
jgi:plastocyanin